MFPQHEPLEPALTVEQIKAAVFHARQHALLIYTLEDSWSIEALRGQLAAWDLFMAQFEGHPIQSVLWRAFEHEAFHHPSQAVHHRIAVC